MTFFIVETEDEPMIYFGGGGPDAVQYIVGANGVLHPSATFTRASAGTTEITQGVFSQAAVNEPRYQWVGAKRGLLIEPAATNLLFPSAVAQTMSVAVTAQAYTLSFFGTGSVTLSGAFAGVVAGTGATLKEFTFTPTAGTLTLTVSGSVTQWQLESGAKATSRIVTTSAAATRAPDAPAIATSAFGFNAAEGTFICEYLPHGNDGRVFSSDAVPSKYMALSVTPGTDNGWYANGLPSAPGSNVGAANKGALSYSSGGYFAVSKNASIASESSASDYTTKPDFVNIGTRNRVTPLVIFSLPYYPRKYSAAELQTASA